MNTNLSNEISSALSIDTKERFLKVSKKLQKNLKNENVNTPLSKVQEYLAKSLGFRNFNEIEKFLEEEKIVVDKKNLKNMFKNNLPQLLKTIDSSTLTNLLLDDNNNDMWLMRAIALTSAVSSLYYDCILNNNKFECFEMYRSLFIFSDLFKVFKALEHLKDDDVVDVKIEGYTLSVTKKSDTFKKLHEYFISLPGLQLNAPKQIDATIENHGYLQMQLIKPFGDLTLLEKDICLFDESWLNNKEFHNGYYSELMMDLFDDIKENRKLFYCKYKTNDDTMYLSDVYYFYALIIDPRKKFEIKEKLKLLIRNRNMSIEFYKLMNNIE